MNQLTIKEKKHILEEIKKFENDEHCKNKIASKIFKVGSFYCVLKKEKLNKVREVKLFKTFEEAVKFM